MVMDPKTVHPLCALRKLSQGTGRCGHSKRKSIQVPNDRGRGRANLTLGAKWFVYRKNLSRTTN